MKLIVYETDKMFIKNKGLLLLFLAVIFKLVTLGTENQALNAYVYENQADYLSIINRYSGKITPEVSSAIEAENIAVVDANINLTALRQKYAQGEIPQDQYIYESRLLEEMVNEKELFLIFYSQYVYANEKPEERYLLYDDGWNALLSKERLDWGFILLTIVISASVFCREYESDMRTILIATKKGGKPLITAKLTSVFITVFLCGVLAALIEYLFFKFKFSLPYGDFPLQSLYSFKDSPFHLSLHGTYLLISAYRILGLLILTVLTMFFSVLAKKTIVALSASLMTVVLPYAIPVAPGTQYLLPSPLGFLLAQGFFRGSEEASQGYFSFAIDQFNAISPTTQVWLVVGWLIVSGVMLFVIIHSFSAVKPSRNRSKSVRIMIACVSLLCCLSGCTSFTPIPWPAGRSFNMNTEHLFTRVGDEFVTLYPDFLMENLDTFTIEKVVRDPFIDDDTIASSVLSVFSRGDKLDYLINTEEELKIVELDPVSSRTSVIYLEKHQTDPVLLNKDLDVHRTTVGKQAITFFINGEDLYLYSDSSLQKINLINGSKETIAKDIYPIRVSFDGEKLYYITNSYEIFEYTISNGENKAIADIRADALYLYNEKIYYQNIEQGGKVFVYDLAQKTNKQVISEASQSFAVENPYIYYINDEDLFLYRADLQSGMSQLILPKHGFDIQLFEGSPFFNYRAFGDSLAMEYYRIDKATLSYEQIYLNYP